MQPGTDLGASASCGFPQTKTKGPQEGDLGCTHPHLPVCSSSTWGDASHFAADETLKNIVLLMGNPKPHSHIFTD